MKKIKSPVDVEHSFKNRKVVLKANEWAVFDDYYADEMKRIFPFIDIAPAKEEDIKVAGTKKTTEDKEETKEETAKKDKKSTKKEKSKK